MRVLAQCGTALRAVVHDTECRATLVPQSVLMAVVLAMPWWFGGVEAKAQCWLSVGVLTALGCWLAGRRSSDGEAIALPPAIAPLLLAVGLGCLQLVPFGEGTMAVLSPKAAEVRRELLSVGDPSEVRLLEAVRVPAAPERFPISLYPASTRRDLSLLIAAVTVFLLGVLLFRSPAAQMPLCVLVVANGTAVALFGMVQKLTWDGRLYWSIPLADGVPFGPFVNRNNGGGYLNLCLGCAVALAVWVFHDRPREQSVWCRRGTHRSTRFLRRQWRGLLEFVARLSGAKIFALAAAGCIAGGVLVSLSRGAGLAMLAAVVLLAIPLAAAGRQRAWWLLGAAVVAGGLFLGRWIDMGEAIQSRFATLLDRNTLAQTRIPNWLDAAKAVPDFCRLGSGLGTYRHVYRLYQDRFDELWYRHAENEYLEWLVEGGAPTLLLALVAVALVGWAARRIVRDDDDPRSVAMAVGGLFALIAQAIQSLFDFGLHVPANVVLLAMICGAMTGRAAELARQGRTARRLALPSSCAPTNLLAAALAVGCVLGGWQMHRTADVEAALRATRWAKVPGDVSRLELIENLSQLERAVDACGDDAEARYRLAALRLHVSRTDFPIRPSDGLHSDGLGSLSYNPADGLLASALRDLVLARRDCPLIPDVHVGIAELCPPADAASADRIHVDRARRLASGNVDVLFRCGLVDYRAGRYERAWPAWRASLTLFPRYLDNVIELAGRQLSPEQLVEKVLPESLAHTPEGDSPIFAAKAAKIGTVPMYAGRGQSHFRGENRDSPHERLRELSGPLAQQGQHGGSCPCRP